MTEEPGSKASHEYGAWQHESLAETVQPGAAYKRMPHGWYGEDTIGSATKHSLSSLAQL